MLYDCGLFFLQTLIENGLRERVILRVDGGCRSGVDVMMATPTGQLLVWQMRAITHPVAIIATEPNPYSSSKLLGSSS